MSRVEEARRRAEGRNVHDDRAYSNATVDTLTAEESALEEYPHERRLDRPKSAKLSRPIAAPRAAWSGQLGPLDPSFDGKLVGSPDTPPMVVEQYRRLAASLHELQVDTGLKTVMVTSATPREGKTL